MRSLPAPAEAFLHDCRTLRRMSAATLTAYRRDLTELAQLAAAAQVADLRALTQAEVRRFAARLHVAAWRPPRWRVCCRPGAASTAGWGSGRR